MPSTNADRIIHRITALHKSLQLDEGGHVSSMERDLMLNYLRELYEIYASGEIAPPKSDTNRIGADRTDRAKEQQEPSTPAPPAPVPSTAPASVKAPPSVSAPPNPPQAAPPSEHTPAPKAARPAPPRQPEVPPIPSVPVPPPPAPVIAEHTAIVQPDYTPAVAPQPQTSAANTPTATAAEDKELAELFEDKGAPGRFGRQPLSDLTRALSINNRILFSRDLFGGDNDLLNTTLQQLNTLRDFNEAKPLLTSFARRYEWASDSNREAAQEFCELVRRRYV